MRTRTAEKILSETPQETKDKVIETANEMVGINLQTFEIILDKEWQKGKYVIGFDDYEEEHIPINTFNKIKEFLGFK